VQHQRQYATTNEDNNTLSVQSVYHAKFYYYKILLLPVTYLLIYLLTYTISTCLFVATIINIHSAVKVVANDLVYKVETKTPEYFSLLPRRSKKTASQSQEENELKIGNLRLPLTCLMAIGCTKHLGTIAV